MSLKESHLKSTLQKKPQEGIKYEIRAVQLLVNDFSHIYMTGALAV